MPSPTVHQGQKAAFAEAVLAQGAHFTYSAFTLFPRRWTAEMAVCQAQPKDNLGFNWIFLLSRSLLNCVTCPTRTEKK